MENWKYPWELICIDEADGNECSGGDTNLSIKLTDNTGKWSSCTIRSLWSIFKAAQFLDAIFSFSQQIVQMITQRIGRFNWIKEKQMRNVEKREPLKSIWNRKTEEDSKMDTESKSRSIQMIRNCKRKTKRCEIHTFISFRCTML